MSNKIPKDLPSKIESPREILHREHQNVLVLQLADDIALALLHNPKIDQFLGRSPLDPGRVGDHDNAGAALAHAARRLAVQYCEALDALMNPVGAEKEDPNQIPLIAKEAS